MASKSLWQVFPVRSPMGAGLKGVGAYRRFSCCSVRCAEQQQPANHNSSERTTHFGFETVPESAKQAKVAGVFTSVAPSYDTMNDLMSLGIHRLWKDHFVRALNPGSPTHPLRILDIAGGTGDIAFRLLNHATDINHDLKTEVIVSDINPHMLAVGRRRARESRYGEGGRLRFLEANAEDLKSAGIADNSIDLYTLAFGIRNFTSPIPALREAYRVLKPGGVFACLEFSHIPTSKSVPHYLLNKAYKIWSFGAIPLIGQLVAGDRASYSYLVESIERFPRQEEFAGMLRDVGFVLPKGWEKGREGEGEGWEDLSGGIVAVHRGIKPLG